MGFRLLRRSQESAPLICECGEPLDVRVVGAAQRWGGEPAVLVRCLHCARCGDVKGR